MNEERVKEYYKGKEIRDAKPKEKVEETEVKANKEKPIAMMFFTVSTLSKEGRPVHLLVKTESALQALTYVQEVRKYPVMGVHVTEYQEFIDAQAHYAAEQKSGLITPLDT